MKNSKTVLRCHCGAKTILKRTSDMPNINSSYDYMYVCAHYPECDSYVFAHNSNKKPMGYLADRKLRRLRRFTHQVFNQIYLAGIMSKKCAYQWLAVILEIPEEKAHIGYLSADQCYYLIKKTELILKEYNKNPKIDIAA